MPWGVGRESNWVGGLDEKGKRGWGKRGRTLRVVAIVRVGEMRSKRRRGKACIVGVERGISE